jgi:hypothetical protein
MNFAMCVILIRLFLRALLKPFSRSLRVKQRVGERVMAELTHAGAVQAVDFGRLLHQHNAASDTTDDAPDLQSVLSSAELSRRASRPPDHAAENRALITLMHELATSPHGILRKLAEIAMAIFRTGKRVRGLMAQTCCWSRARPR